MLLARMDRLGLRAQLGHRESLERQVLREKLDLLVLEVKMAQ